MRSQHTDDTGDTADLGRPTRRTLAKGAVWTVPVAVVGAAAPAMAASPVGSGTITGFCTGGVGVSTSLEATFQLDVSGSTASSITVVFSYSGTAGGSFTVSAPANWGPASGSSPTITYQVPVGNATGTATVTFANIPQDGTGTVTATIEATPPFASGDQVASVSKNRSGNSPNYACSVPS